MSIENQFYLLIGFFTGVESADHLNFDLCSYHLINFSNLALKSTSDTLKSIHPSLNDSRLIEKLKETATNNPDKFDLTWFHYYFKHQISVL